MKFAGSLRALSFSILIVAGVCATNVTNLQAQGDSAEIEHYTLTMDKVTRIMQTFAELKKYAKDHPEANSATSNDDGDKNSLADLETKIKKYPPLVSILQAHNFAVREFVVAELAFFQAAMANALDPSAKAPAGSGVNDANLKFMRDHKAEIEALGKQYGMASGSD